MQHDACCFVFLVLFEHFCAFVILLALFLFLFLPFRNHSNNNMKLKTQRPAITQSHHEKVYGRNFELDTIVCLLYDSTPSSCCAVLFIIHFNY
jgi:hypothetical protein